MGDRGSEQELLTLLHRHTEAWNSHDLAHLMSLFAEDCVFEASGGDQVHGQRYEGKAEVERAFAEVFETMPDAQWGDGRHFVLTPDLGVSLWTLRATLSGDRRLEVDGCDFLTFNDGEIVLKTSFRKQRPPL